MLWAAKQRERAKRLSGSWWDGWKKVLDPPRSVSLCLSIGSVVVTISSCILKEGDMLCKGGRSSYRATQSDHRMSFVCAHHHQPPGLVTGLPSVSCKDGIGRASVWQEYLWLGPETWNHKNTLGILTYVVLNVQQWNWLFTPSCSNNNMWWFFL